MGCKSALGTSTVFSKAKEKVEGLGEVEGGDPWAFPSSSRNSAAAGGQGWITSRQHLEKTLKH